MTQGPYIPVQKEMGGQAQTGTGQVPEPGRVVNCLLMLKMLCCFSRPVQ